MGMAVEVRSQLHASLCCTPGRNLRCLSPSTGEGLCDLESGFLEGSSMIGSGGDRLRAGVMFALALCDGRGLSGDLGTKEEADAFSNFTESQLADNDLWIFEMGSV